MESCCPCILHTLIPKGSIFLHLPNFSHPKSSSRWKTPTNPLYSRPISLFKQKPTSQDTKSTGFELDSQGGNRKIPLGLEESELKWASDEIRVEKISNSCTTGAMCTRVLRRFVESRRLVEARDLYFEMKEVGFDPGVVLETALIDMFMKSGWVSDAFRVFDRMSERNVVTWTSIIYGCVLNHRQEVAFELFVDMMESGVLPNDFTFNVVLQACADRAGVDLGKQFHSLVIRAGFEGDSRIGNCLIDFYSKCCLISEARKVFSRMEKPDLVSFTSMIVGFCKNHLFESAVSLLDKMRWLGFDPNEHTITSILTSCVSVLGEQIHSYMIKTLLHQSIYSATALIEFYSRRNSIEKAKMVFDKLEARNVVTWSTMISCFLQNGLVADALELFCEMTYSGIKPNEYTFATVIGACSFFSEPITLGLQLHCLIIKLNLGSDDRIFNSLLTMYARNGMVEELSRVFDKIQDPDIVSWCAVISGYSQNGLSEKSAGLLCVMHRKGVKPNEFAFSSALASCANLALLDQGRLFHSLGLKLGWDFDICVGNALVNMYAKSGSIYDARLAFDGMPGHDVMSWNTLIHGYAQHGHGVEALRVFDEMVESGCVKPNHATFVGVLSACNHVGYLEEALWYFRAMDSHYSVPPSLSHYACIVDMMGRAGRLNEAAQIIDKMPFEPDSVIWKSLLGSCAVHKNLELGKIAAMRAIELSPKDSANYILISNLHAAFGEWEKAEQMRKMMEENGVKKDAGWSWIEICSEVHAFTARDRSHPRTEAIYNQLDELIKELKEDGYPPDLSFAIYDL